MMRALRILFCVHLLLVAPAAQAGWLLPARDRTERRAVSPEKKYILEPWAVVSLVAGILGVVLAPLALVASGIAHRRIIRYSRRGENVANIGGLLGWVFLLPFLFLLAVLLL